MKRVISIVLQFILYFVVFAVGSLLPAFHVLPQLSFRIGVGRVFVYDGLLLLLVIYILVLLLGAARRRLASAWPNATIALVLALLLGLAMKFGFKST